MNEENKAIAIREPSPMEMVFAAVKDKDIDATKLRELLQVRREMMADDAAAAFNRAVCTFQAQSKIIAKGDSANGIGYASLDRIWRGVRELMDKCALSVTWENVRTESNICKLDGHLRHAQGHAQPIHFELPIPAAITNRDGKAVQNAAQVMGVAVTYAKRYGLCACLGILTGEDTDAAVERIERPKFTMPKPADKQEK